MKIAIDKSILTNALEVASKAVATKSTVQILEGVLIEASERNLRITANNLDVGIETTVECEVIKPGSIVVNAKLLSDIVKKMPDEEIDIIVNDKEMVIEAGKTKMKIAGFESVGFPAISKVKVDKSFEMDARVFRDMVSKVSFAVYTLDDKSAAMKGVLFDILSGTLNTVAMDSHTLAMRSSNIEAEDSNVIIAGKDLDTVAKIFNEGNIKIYIGGNMTLIEDANTKVSLRLLDGDFIPYRKILPSAFNIEAQIKTKDLQLSIERSLLLFETNLDMAIRTPVEIVIKDNMLKVSIDTTRGSINDEIEADVTGDSIKILLNPKQLNECLKRIEDREMCMKFINNINPCIMTPVEGDKFLYLVAPINPKI